MTAECQSTTALKQPVDQFLPIPQMPLYGLQRLLVSGLATVAEPRVWKLGPRSQSCGHLLYGRVHHLGDRGCRRRATWASRCVRRPADRR
jgi:hypothetical protein